MYHSSSAQAACCHPDYWPGAAGMKTIPASSPLVVVSTVNFRPPQSTATSKGRSRTTGLGGEWKNSAESDEEDDNLELDLEQKNLARIEHLLFDVQVRKSLHRSLRVSPCYRLPCLSFCPLNLSEGLDCTSKLASNLEVESSCCFGQFSCLRHSWKVSCPPSCTCKPRTLS